MFDLSEAPSDAAGEVKAWQGEYVYPAAPLVSGSPHPDFSAYPAPVVLDSTGPLTRMAREVRLENRWLSVVVLADAGGRLQLLLDQESRRILYEDPDKRPRLAELAPTLIEDSADGARTAWCCTFDRNTRVRIRTGYCLYPGRNYLHIKVFVSNITPLEQFFRWQRPFEDSPATAEVSEAPAGVVRLMPFETRSFNHYLLGLPETLAGHGGGLATADAFARTEVNGQTVRFIFAATSSFVRAVAEIFLGDDAIASETLDLEPNRAFSMEALLPEGAEPNRAGFRLRNSFGRELLAIDRRAVITLGPATVPPATFDPGKIPSNDGVLRAAEHFLAQRDDAHAQRFYLDALRRDRESSRALLGLGTLHLRHGEFDDADAALRRCLTLVPTSAPEYAVGSYYRGLCLRFLGRHEEARVSFETAQNDAAWRSSALQALAEDDCRRERWDHAARHLYAALRLNADNNTVRDLASLVMKKFGRGEQSARLLEESLAIDGFDALAQHLTGRPLNLDNRARLDVAFECIRGGLHEPAFQLLTAADVLTADGSVPLVLYTLAYLYLVTGNIEAASRAAQSASQSSPARCFPYRLDLLPVLESAVRVNPQDAHAFLYLGLWYRAHGRNSEALDCWQIAAQLDSKLAAAHRNFGAAQAEQGDLKLALAAYEQACAADPSDTQLIWERDQVLALLGTAPDVRSALLEGARYDFEKRPEIGEEWLRLMSAAGREQKASESPTEMGPLAGTHAAADVELQRALDALVEGHMQEAVNILQAVKRPDCAVFFWLGEALAATDGQAEAQSARTSAIGCPGFGGEPDGDLEAVFYRALAVARLGDDRTARHNLRELWFRGRRVARWNRLGPPLRTPGKLEMPGAEERANKLRGLLAQLQSRIGLRQRKLAQRTADQIFSIDPYHRETHQLLHPALLSRLSV